MPRRMMIIVIGVVFLTPMVRAMDLQSLTDIEQAAYMHAYEEAMAHYNNPQIVVDALDDRLRLSSCEQSLITFSKTAPNTLGNRTIGVKCQMPTDWTVYVPVKVKVLKKVVVATRPLAARQVLSRQDLQIQMMDISELNQGYLLKVSDVVGC
jgi:flagella basal body P-ring formation protein FlgA